MNESTDQKSHKAWCCIVVVIVIVIVDTTHQIQKERRRRRVEGGAKTKEKVKFSGVGGTLRQIAHDLRQKN